MNEETDGLLDSNVFVHAQTTDEQSAECRRFVTALQLGHVRAWLDPMVLHELSYALPFYRKQMGREQIADYLLSVLIWPGVLGDKALMAETVTRWAATPGLSFVDAYLAVLAHRRRCPVYTKNVKHLVGQGVEVPNPLPSGPST